ncbi:MAG: Crp/Fnr family transcriptional regulator [Rhodobacteraceae bacterium]|nr:Crp/Fnr family transcriptional regulator [Paracoccaceae bacterium]
MPLDPFLPDPGPAATLPPACAVGAAQPPGCESCSVRSRSDWAGLPPRAAAVVSRVKQRRALAEGAVLFREGDANLGLYCVSSGLIGLRMTHENGTEALVGFGWPGDTLGARAFLRNGPHRTTAVALTAAAVCVLLRRDAVRLTQETPEVHAALVERCLAAMDEAQGGLLQNAALSNRDRLAALVLRLARQLSLRPGEDRARLRLPVARGDLAAMLGIQPESLSRLFGRLKAEGLVRLSGRTLDIPSVARLAANAGGRAAA